MPHILLTIYKELGFYICDSNLKSYELSYSYIVVFSVIAKITKTFPII